MPFDLKFSHKNPLLANRGVGIIHPSISLPSSSLYWPCILSPCVSIVITTGDRACLQDRQCDNAIHSSIMCTNVKLSS